MTATLIGLITAYVALAVLLLGLCLYSKWHVWVKVGAIVVTSFFYYATYMSLQNLLGWPTQSDLPGEFIMIAGKIAEPDENDESDGAIYIWALSLDGDYVADAPRAYKMPYSKDLHNQVSEANKMIRRGVTQIGRSENITVHKPTAGQTWLDERMQRVIIYDLPDPELPDK